MPLCQHLEKELGAFLGERDISQLIENEEPVTSIAVDHPAQSVVLVGLQEFVSQTTAGNKAGADALPAGLHPQARGQMSFAGTTFAQENDVPVLADIFSGCQLMEQTSVEARARQEGVSMNTLVMVILAEALGKRGGQQKA